MRHLVRADHHAHVRTAGQLLVEESADPGGDLVGRAQRTEALRPRHGLGRKLQRMRRADLPEPLAASTVTPAGGVVAQWVARRQRLAGRPTDRRSAVVPQLREPRAELRTDGPAVPELTP